MKSSRNLSDLQPHVADKCQAHIDACRAEGIDILVTCTLRDFEEQTRLYAQGRTQPGGIVTWARGGESSHNYAVAYDVVPMRNGKPVWTTIPDADAALWLRVGELGEKCGMEWGGRWLGKKIDRPHFQDLGGKTIEQLKAEKVGTA